LFQIKLLQLTVSRSPVTTSITGIDWYRPSKCSVKLTSIAICANINNVMFVHNPNRTRFSNTFLLHLFNKSINRCVATNNILGGNQDSLRLTGNWQL